MSYLFSFMKLPKIPARGIIRLSIVAVLLSGCNTFDFQISQECGEFANEIQGEVRDSSTRQPIAGAEVVMRSRGVGSCPNSRPIEETRLVTDELGNFYHSVFIFADDQLEMEVTAPDCDPYTRDDVTYRDFNTTSGGIPGMLIELNCID